jgi:glyoxylate/hydroxypyruvate reductase A
MALLFKTSSDRGPWWRAEFKKALPDLEFRLFPELGGKEDIEFALVWQPDPGFLKSLPNLRAIFSLGAGVDHILVDRDLPSGVPIVRLVDEQLTRQMTEYAVLYALSFHRQAPAYAEMQRQKRWREFPQKMTNERRVGVMGVGEIGGAVARALASLGFDVAGWARTKREGAGFPVYAGRDRLYDFLARSDIVICVLPLTQETRDILDARAFAAMPKGGYVINIGRGPQVAEQDLIAALDKGHLAGAALDVFRAEPLPAASPLWAHPKIAVTPHIAAITDPRSALRQVVENIKRIRRGEAPLNVVDPKRGY